MRLVYLLLFLACLVIQYPLWLGDSGYQKVSQLQDDLQNQLLKNQALTARNNAMRAEIDDLKNGDQALEERARGEVGMIGQNEILVQIVPNNPSVTTSSKPKK